MANPYRHPISTPVPELQGIATIAAPAGAAMPDDAVERWKLVPVEPSTKMTIAFHNASPHRPTGWTADEAWRVMLEAAPDAPPTSIIEAIRLAYKTGHNEGYIDATDDGTGNGYPDHDAAEEGWQQYQEKHLA